MFRTLLLTGIGFAMAGSLAAQNRSEEFYNNTAASRFDRLAKAKDLSAAERALSGLRTGHPSNASYQNLTSQQKSRIQAGLEQMLELSHTKLATRTNIESDSSSSSIVQNFQLFSLAQSAKEAPKNALIPKISMKLDAQEKAVDQIQALFSAVEDVIDNPEKYETEGEVAIKKSDLPTRESITKQLTSGDYVVLRQESKIEGRALLRNSRTRMQEDADGNIILVSHTAMDEEGNLYRLVKRSELTADDLRANSDTHKTAEIILGNEAQLVDVLKRVQPEAYDWAKYENSQEAYSALAKKLQEALAPTQLGLEEKVPALFESLMKPEAC